MFTNNGSLCGTPESNRTSYVNYTPIKTILDSAMSPGMQDVGEKRGTLGRQISKYRNREAVKSKQANTTEP